jgi:hypothetical protein
MMHASEESSFSFILTSYGETKRERERERELAKERERGI